MFKTYHVRQHNVRQSLMSMLRRVFPDMRDDQIRSMISRRRIQIDGNVCVDSRRVLKANEVIRVYDSPLARPIESSDINIRFQDEHLMVVEKPAGVTSVRGDDEEGRRDKSPTLDELLQQRIDRDGLSKLPGRGAGAGAKNQKDRRQLASNMQSNRLKVKIRPVHRLDRDTSGLMLFALSPAAEEKLNAMFAEHSIDRAYLAVAQGVVDSQKIESDFVRDRGDGLRGSVIGDAAPDESKRASAKHAITHIKLVRHIGAAYSLLDCRLETGRTHQIRIHLAELGHPLCGEKTYTRPKVGADPIKDESAAPRQALHAHRLHFVHPITAKPHTFESKFPRDLHKWLTKLEDSFK